MFFFFFLISFLLFVYFSIKNNWCRDSKLSSVGDVHHDCCFHFCYESSDLLFYPRRSERSLFSLLIWLISFCAEIVWVTVFSKLWEIFGRLVHVHLEDNGVAHLISNTWLLKKILSNCKWCIPLKKGNPATHKTVRFVALINYYAVNFCYWNVFLLYWS